MGNDSSVPEPELTDLINTTHFNKSDIKRWYKKFMKNFPDGQMNEQQFFSIYGNLFSSENTIAKNIFRSFDHNNDGFISFKELMITLSMTTAGTNEEKLEWLFTVYDYDGNGQISIEEVQQMAKLIHDSMKADGAAEHDEEYLSFIFDVVDDDGNGYWTKEEFIQGVQEHPVLVKLLCAPTDSMAAKGGGKEQQQQPQKKK